MKRLFVPLSTTILALFVTAVFAQGQTGYIGFQNSNDLDWDGDGDDDISVVTATGMEIFDDIGSVSAFAFFFDSPDTTELFSARFENGTVCSVFYGWHDDVGVTPPPWAVGHTILPAAVGVYGTSSADTVQISVTPGALLNAEFQAWQASFPVATSTILYDDPATTLGLVIDSAGVLLVTGAAPFGVGFLVTSPLAVAVPHTILGKPIFIDIGNFQAYRINFDGSGNFSFPSVSCAMPADLFVQAVDVTPTGIDVSPCRDATWN